MFHSHSVFVCSGSAARLVEAQLRWRRPASTQPWLAPARFPPCTDGQAARDRDRVDPTQRFSGLETCPLISRLAPEVRAQDTRGECEVTPRYLRLGCCHPVSRPGGDKARFPDESGSASQPWCQSNLPTRLETNLPPVPRPLLPERKKWEKYAKSRCLSAHHPLRRETPFPAFNSTLFRRQGIAQGGCDSFTG